MKKLIAIMLGLMLIFNSTTVFAEETVPHIKINSLDEINNYHFNYDGEYGLKAVFILEDNNLLRGEICPKCNKGSLTSRTEVEVWNLTSIHCPASPGSDMLKENRYYKVVKCSQSCGFEVRTYIKTVWTVECFNIDDGGLYPSLFTIGQGGTNIHCYIDPENPNEPPVIPWRLYHLYFKMQS